MKIGEHIKTYRELRNITREDISSRLYLSLGAYSKIERNETEITVSRLYEISKILNVPAPSLLESPQKFMFNDNGYLHAEDTENLHYKITPDVLIMITETIRLLNENMAIQNNILTKMKQQQLITHHP